MILSRLRSPAGALQGCLLLLVSALASADYYQRPFSGDSPWNQPLAAALPENSSRRPLDLDAGAHVHINSNSWSIPFYLAGTDVPDRPIYIRKLGGYVMAPVPEGAAPAPGTDAHLAVMSADRQIIHEFFRYDQAGEAEIYRQVDSAGPGVALQAGQNIGTRAYGGSSVGGLIRQWELEQGVARHALALALSLNFLSSGYVAPATSEDQAGAESYTGSIPMGSLLVLPPALVPESMLEEPLAILIARALQEYGGYVIDSGGSDAMLFYAEPGFDDEDVARSSKELSRIIPFLQLVERPAGKPAPPVDSGSESVLKDAGGGDDPE